MPSTIYISPTGNDSNTGTSAAPMRTLEAAKDALTDKSGTILVRGGDYDGVRLDLSDVTDLKIMAVNNERPRFLFGEKLSGITKTSGYTNVYQATLVNGAVPYVAIYEDGTPYGKINEDEVSRHPLQAGREYRCDSYPLLAADDIPAVDSTPASYYYDDGAKVIYFHAPDSADPSSRDYYVLWRAGVLWNGADKQTGFVQVSGIACYYADAAFNFSYCAGYKAIDCLSVACRLTGIQADNVGYGEELHCESALCGIDGFNYHNATGNDFRESKIIQISPYSHDNFDDGVSPHENNQMPILGGLFEYNRDRGVASALGAHTSKQMEMTLQWAFALAFNGIKNPFMSIPPLNKK